MLDVLIGINLIIIGIIDIRTYRIPNLSVLILVFLGIANGYVFNLYVGVLRNIYGLILGLLIFLPFYLIKVMGAGDVKLFAAVGCINGPEYLINSILNISIIGGVIALAFACKKGILKKALRNLFIIFKYLFFRIIKLYEIEQFISSHEIIPYGFAISLGAILTFFYKPVGV